MCLVCGIISYQLELSAKIFRVTILFAESTKPGGPGGLTLASAFSFIALSLALMLLALAFSALWGH